MIAHSSNSAPSGLKINLGCGPSGIDGWENYDWGALPLLSKFPFLRSLTVRAGLLPRGYHVPWPRIRLVDIRRKLPLRDGAAAFIYCSHVLEHLERWRALDVAKECRRVLAPGGRLRIAVPDLAWICHTYLTASRRPTDDARPAQAACRLLWGHPKDERPSGPFARWRRRFIRGHEWAYDEAEMRLLLHQAGFEEISRCSFRKGAFPDLDLIELEGHAVHSLYMEAGRERAQASDSSVHVPSRSSRA